MPHIYVPPQNQEEPFPIFAAIVSWGFGLLVTAFAVFLLTITVSDMQSGRLQINLGLGMWMAIGLIPPTIFLRVVYLKMKKIYKRMSK